MKIYYNDDYRDKSIPLQKTVAKEGKLISESSTFIENEEDFELSTILVSRIYEYMDKQYLIYMDENYRVKFPNVEAPEYIL